MLTEADISLQTFSIMFNSKHTDTSWFLANINSVNEKIVNVKNGTYAANSVNSVDTCLSAGDYNFTVFDQYGKIIAMPRILLLLLQFILNLPLKKQVTECAVPTEMGTYECVWMVEKFYLQSPSKRF